MEFRKNIKEKLFSNGEQLDRIKQGSAMRVEVWKEGVRGSFLIFEVRFYERDFDRK